MVHVLIDDDPRRLAVLAPLLDSWGVTYEPRSPVDAAVAAPTVRDCDAVIRFLDGEGGDEQAPASPPGPGVLAPAGDGPAAPCVAVTAGPAPGDAFMVLDPTAPLESSLHDAILACRDQAEALRVGSSRNRRGPHARERLSHELRTPLTAIKTALEILATDARLEDDSRRMVGIALRNVARLEESVAWGEELMAAGVAVDAD